MTKEFQNPKHEKPAAEPAGSCSRFRASSFIRHSSFVIRHSTVRLITGVFFLTAFTLADAATSNETLGRLLNLEFQLPAAVVRNSDQTIHLRGKNARQQLL